MCFYVYHSSSVYGVIYALDCGERRFPTKKHLFLQCFSCTTYFYQYNKFCPWRILQRTKFATSDSWKQLATKKKVGRWYDKLVTLCWSHYTSTNTFTCRIVNLAYMLYHWLVTKQPITINTFWHAERVNNSTKTHTLRIGQYRFQIVHTRDTKVTSENIIYTTEKCWFFWNSMWPGHALSIPEPAFLWSVLKEEHMLWRTEMWVTKVKQLDVLTMFSLINWNLWFFCLCCWCGYGALNKNQHLQNKTTLHLVKQNWWLTT